MFLVYSHSHTPHIGCASATQEMMDHESWSAIADNYVYIHNAFRNDLQRIITNCEHNKFNIDELINWKEILELHSRVEDEIIVVALQARLRRQKEDKLPNEILNGTDHDKVAMLTEKCLDCTDNDKRLQLLRDLAIELDNHLNREEEVMMGLLIKYFSKRELWALDSFIVNPKLDYCDTKDSLIQITKWWFSNICISEGRKLLVNFVRAGRQPPMPIEDWKKLQNVIPALKKYSINDIIDAPTQKRIAAP